MNMKKTFVMASVGVCLLTTFGLVKADDCVITATVNGEAVPVLKGKADCRELDIDVRTGNNESHTDFRKIDKNGKLSTAEGGVNEEKGFYGRIDKESFQIIPGQWPENEYTRHIPQPNFSLPIYGVNLKENKFGVFFFKPEDLSIDKNAIIEQIKAYAEKLKARGFTIDAKMIDQAGDQNKYNFAAFSYRAQNSAGYLVRTGSSGGSNILLELYNPKGAQKFLEEEAKRNAKKANPARKRAVTDDFFKSLSDD